MTKYLFPIEIPPARKDSRTKYFFGEMSINDKNPTRVGYCKRKGCNHETAIEASDCFRKFLLDREFRINGGRIKSVKCCRAGCSNHATRQATLGRLINLPLCDDHLNRTIVQEVCGWGVILSLQKEA